MTVTTKRCEACFKTFEPTDYDKGKGSTQWQKRKYCTPECYRNLVKRRTWNY